MTREEYAEMMRLANAIMNSNAFHDGGFSAERLAELVVLFDRSGGNKGDLKVEGGR